MKHALLTLLLLSHSLYAMAEVQVESPYARAVPEGQMNSAAFMGLANQSDNPVNLISAESDVAESVELHTHQNHNGVMQMRQVNSIVLAPQQVTQLEPGGFHIMLINLKQPMNDGQTIKMTLHFSDNTQQDVAIPVKFVIPVQKTMQHAH